MQLLDNMQKIKLVKGDITKQSVEAIVNAANTSLLGGGGVDGAIHRAAGPLLLEECRGLNGCNTGDAKITKAYNLPSKYIIHTVGPVWYGGSNNETEKLSSCYKRSLELALQNNIETIAFPNISTGVYHFPKDIAADIAIKEVRSFLENNKSFKLVVFVVFDEENFEIYNKKLG